MRVLDLSLTIEDHFRWSLGMTRTQSHEGDSLFQTSKLELLCHAFTHVDAPVHFVPGAAVLGDLPLETWVGPADVIDLSDCGPGTEITAKMLEARGSHVRHGGIVLLKTCWDRQSVIGTPEYWSKAPYVASDAAQWLYERAVRCVGFDFPQDEGIRRLVGGESPAREDFVTHEMLLGRGVGLLEYLAGLDQLTENHTFLVAAPLRIPNSDGSPTRAIALEEEKV